MSAKLLTFALAKRKDRDLAQLVAHTSGGREVAGSSPVIPTKIKGNRLIQAVFAFVAGIDSDETRTRFPNMSHHPLPEKLKQWTKKILFNLKHASFL